MQIDKYIWELEGITIDEFRALPNKEKWKLTFRHRGIHIWDECYKCGHIIEFKKWANMPSTWMLTAYRKHLGEHAMHGERHCNCQSFGSTVWE
jgi:hypothetical protein